MGVLESAQLRIKELERTVLELELENQRIRAAQTAWAEVAIKPRLDVLREAAEKLTRIQPIGGTMTEMVLARDLERYIEDQKRG